MNRCSCRVRLVAVLAAWGVFNVSAIADDAKPTELRPVAEGAAPAAVASDLPPTPVIGTPGAAATSDAVVPQVTTAPMPIVAGQTWYGGWSGAYAPSGSYWYHVPGSNLPYAFGNSWGYPSWNGYWNYGTAYGYPGYTAYWHGWYAGPYYYNGWGDGGPGYCGAYYGNRNGDYPYPTWSYNGWGYSAVGWGHGHWHRHRVFAPRYSWHCGW